MLSLLPVSFLGLLLGILFSFQVSNLQSLLCTFIHLHNSKHQTIGYMYLNWKTTTQRYTSSNHIPTILNSCCLNAMLAARVNNSSSITLSLHWQAPSREQTSWREGQDGKSHRPPPTLLTISIATIALQCCTWESFACIKEA